MAGLPHSEIHGSTGARPSPRLIAACYVLHRLSVPRHSPNALRRLIRPPNRNAEANRPPRQQKTNGILSTSSLPAKAITRGSYPPPKTPPKAGHTNLSTMSKSRGQRTENRGQKRLSASSRARPKRSLFRKPPSPGGAERDRTDALLLAKQALSQLSYSPFSEDRGQRTDDSRRIALCRPSSVL